jgi:fatty-acyl-CoA synthase
MFDLLRYTMCGQPVGLKAGGKWIGSRALEDAAVRHPAVRKAAVIAIPHPRWKER